LVCPSEQARLIKRAVTEARQVTVKFRREKLRLERTPNAR
jgi:stress response protein YsnF